MSFVLPKELKDLSAFKFDLLIPVELNDVDVDRVMTPIMEMAVKGGRTAASTTDPTDYRSRLLALAESDKLTGFQTRAGLDVLDGWLRTSVVKFSGTSPVRRAAVKMDYVQPLTIATYRSGLPIRRNRRADELAYHSMILNAQQAGNTHPERAILKHFMDVFGVGVDVGPMPSAQPHYDESTDIDVNGLLALRLLETFPGNSNPRKAKVVTEFAVPGAVAPIGADLLALLRFYGPFMPAAEAMSHLAAVLSLRLFQLPLRTAVAAQAILEDRRTPDLDDSNAPNPMEMYCDFTRQRGGSSDELSQLCVQRDLDNLRSFFANRLLLRTLHQAADLLDDGHNLQHLHPTEQLMRVGALRSGPEMQAALRMQLKRIEQALDDSDAGEVGRALIREVRSSGLSAADQVTAVLVEGLGRKGLQSQVTWFHTTGGINKSYGLLSGALKHRTTWRYAPSDELLTALLALCFVEPSGRQTSSRLPVAEVLERLERRFGLLIARPPAMFDGPDARAGATNNLHAFIQKLQLLGCFQSLSDDFSAQFVNRPRREAAA